MNYNNDFKNIYVEKSLPIINEIEINPLISKNILKYQKLHKHILNSKGFDCFSMTKLSLKENKYEIESVKDTNILLNSKDIEYNKEPFTVNIHGMIFNILRSININKNNIFIYKHENDFNTITDNNIFEITFFEKRISNTESILNKNYENEFDVNFVKFKEFSNKIKNIKIEKNSNIYISIDYDKKNILKFSVFECEDKYSTNASLLFSEEIEVTCIQYNSKKLKILFNNIVFQDALIPFFEINPNKFKIKMDDDSIVILESTNLKSVFSTVYYE